jgi:hypothetical protein
MVNISSPKELGAVKTRFHLGIEMPEDSRALFLKMTMLLSYYILWVLRIALLIDLQFLSDYIIITYQGCEVFLK